MIASEQVDGKTPIVCVIGPTASGKSARAIQIAKERDGEVISVDSRQVYRMLDIGTEKITKEEMASVPHHLIDVCGAKDTYSAGDFVHDATRIIDDIRARGKVAILAGGTHFYFDALINGLPTEIPANPEYRKELEQLPVEELARMIQERDPRRAERIDLQNRRRLIRALEIIEKRGSVPDRVLKEVYEVEWVIIDPDREVLRERINKRLQEAFDRGLIEEVRKVREYVGDERLHELGLEYRVVGEYLRGEREEATMLLSLASKLWQYARHQKAWIRKLKG